MRVVETFEHRKTVFHMKILFINNFTTKLLSIKDYNQWTPIERSLRSLLRSLKLKLLVDNIFIERLGLSLWVSQVYRKSDPHIKRSKGAFSWKPS
jgi:hypothetical protein